MTHIAQALNPTTPSWVPLERLFSPQECGAFMWMYRVSPNGQVVECYKHIRTRRYLNLDHQGQAYQCSHPEAFSNEPCYHPILLGDAILATLS